VTSIEVRSAALVERTPEGTLRVPEGGDAVIGAGTAAGGLTGMLVGVLGGPLGVLLGFGAGALVGGAFDIDRATGVDSALSLLSAQIPPGTTALIVETVETSPEPLDQLAARYGATVERQPAAQVTAEVDAAEAAAEAAQKEPGRVLRERKRTEAKERSTEGRCHEGEAAPRLILATTTQRGTPSVPPSAGRRPAEGTTRHKGREQP
jgi:uncharacterized membrane protein